MSKDVIKDFTEIVEFYREKGGRDTFKVLKNTLDLINRQQAEIEQWKEEANRYQTLWCEDVQTAKTEAIKEFADKTLEQVGFYISKTDKEINEKIIKKEKTIDDIHYLQGGLSVLYEINSMISNLVKEMVGEK